MSNKNATPSDSNRIITNTVTDTGVGFELGNTLIAFPVSPISASISAGIGLLCAAARASGEIQASDHAGEISTRFNRLANFLPETVRKSLTYMNSKMSNLGSSLMVSGTALCISGLYAGATEGIDLSSLSSFYEQGKEAFILGTFGVANFMRGHARGLEDGCIQQKIQDVVGITLASVGVTMTGDLLNYNGLLELDPVALSDAAIKGTFVGAAASSMYEAVKGETIIDNCRGDLIFALGCTFNSLMSVHNGDYYSAAANLSFASAFVSLDALKQDGGFYQKYSSPKAPQ